jgi:hypothetical protein
MNLRTNASLSEATWRTISACLGLSVSKPKTRLSTSSGDFLGRLALVGRVGIDATYRMSAPGGSSRTRRIHPRSIGPPCNQDSRVLVRGTAHVNEGQVD